MATFTEEVSQRNIPNVVTTTQPRAFLADSVIDPTTLPVDQSLGLSPTALFQQPFMFEPMKSAQQPSIVGGLFSPELRSAEEMQYLQNRQRAMQNEALAYAQLSPIEKAQYSFYRGGQQLGDALSGALGGQDPQLRMIALQQQILSELDPSDPEQNLMIAQKYARVAPELSSKIADNARKAQFQIASTAQKLREKQGTDPFEQLLRTGKYTPASMAAYKISKDVADLREVDSPNKIPARIQEAQEVAKSKGFKEGTPEYNAEIVNYLEKTEKEPSVGADREAFSKSEFGKKFNDLTQDQQKTINRMVDEERQKQAKAGAIILPGQPVPPKDWLPFISQISKDPVMDRTSIVISDAPNAIETIRMSTTNDIAAAALPGALARLTGEGKNMSNQDVNRYARTGGLDKRLAQDAVSFFTGKKTNATKTEAERFATAVYRGALLERRKFIKDQAEQFGYDKSPNYETAIKQIDEKLSQFRLITPGGEKTPAPGAKFDAEKEKRYQEWKNKQLGVQP